MMNQKIWLIQTHVAMQHNIGKGGTFCITGSTLGLVYYCIAAPKIIVIRQLPIMHDIYL